MTDYAADTAVVNSLVYVRVEERRLEDGCREADLVGGRVIVSVYGLRSHLPLGLVNRLVHLARDIVLREECADVLHVLEERELLVYVEVGVVLPLVGVAHLHDEVGELVLSLRLCSGRHPCSLVDALRESLLQVAHELNHLLLRRLGEVLLYVELADSLAEHAAHESCGTLPARTVLLYA